MALDPRAIQIYTDGSCYKNPGGESGCAAIAHFPEHLGCPDEQILDFGCGESSNNRMELMACIAGLQILKQPAAVVLFSDSSYVVNGIEKGWAQRWRANAELTEYICQANNKYLQRLTDDFNQPLFGPRKAD